MILMSGQDRFVIEGQAEADWVLEKIKVND
jgi:hypothetical protein